jgi:peptidyl-prolyl cis-trans isomerase C
MKRYVIISVWFAIFVFVLGSSCRRKPSAGTETGRPEPNAPAKVDTESFEPRQIAKVDPNEVVVMVNGQAITEGRLQEEINKLAKQIQPEIFEKNKERIRQQVLGALIGIQLLEERAKAANIVVTEEDINEQIKELASRQNLTVEELKELLQKGSVDFEDWKGQMEFERRARFEKLFDIELADEIRVTDNDANNYYTANIKRYEVPEQVRASHILIRPDTSDPNTDPNEAKAQALAKAQELLKQIKEGGADFAELAKASSDSASKEKGGDLGFQPRGAWVKPFEDAAFALETGQISDVVQTPFGYHIIKVTDRKEAYTRTFDQVKDQIIKMLKQQKANEHVLKYIESLKAKAEIVYPPGKEPAPMPVGP